MRARDASGSGTLAAPVALLVASAVAVACAIAPFLRWVEITGAECGWTCYVPLPYGTRSLKLIDADGWTVLAPLQVALLVVAIAAAVAALARARRHPLARRAWAVFVTLAGVAFVWALVDVLAWSPAGADAPGADAFALHGPGAIVALVATGAATILGCAQLAAGRRAAAGD